MAKITLEKLRHSYLPHPKTDEDYALKQLDIDWRDGGAYALLGPSGCGKSTLLNIISGLLIPSEGRVLFDDKDMTRRTPDERNIAQVFQFPVIYDTMSVYDNLAFPLRNRGYDEAKVKDRAMAIADMLELNDIIHSRAAKLSPDIRQKISMGRGLVREDVNVMMFDEPLTVIDPHLKWKLRSKLKELHQNVKTTMIYVTHDQTEALTFADKVVVMKDGLVVQIGTPADLHERPNHIFVGHFIGSPGMNILKCDKADQGVKLADEVYQFEGNEELEKEYRKNKTGELRLGIRPEFIEVTNDKTPKQGHLCLPAHITRIAPIGRHLQLDITLQDQSLKAILNEDQAINEGDVMIHLPHQHIHIYFDGWRIKKRDEKDE